MANIIEGKERRQVVVEVTTTYTLQIDMESDIVKEYEDMDDLVSDCVSYNFSSVLPVIADGDVIVEEGIDEWQIIS